MGKLTIEELAAFCKRKGFVYPNSEIYGGMSGFFDYGPLGIELKKQPQGRMVEGSRPPEAGCSGNGR